MNPLFRNMASPRRTSCRRSVSFRSDGLAFRKAILPALLLCASALGGCSTFTPPEISYDSDVPPLPQPPVPADDKPRPLHVPPLWKPALGGKIGSKEETEPASRVETANSAARVEPRKKGYFNAAQVYAYSPGALYQVYAAPGQITDIALEDGEQLTGSGPVAAGDTVRWVVGDTESGSADTRRVHILVKPRRFDRNQSCRQHRSAHLPDRAACPRKALHAFGRLVLSGGAVGQGAVGAFDAGATRSEAASFPLCH